ncbi:MAG: hypothetical protein V3U48_07090, partial [Rhodospirillales bacterium]
DPANWFSLLSRACKSGVMSGAPDFGQFRRVNRQAVQSVDIDLDHIQPGDQAFRYIMDFSGFGPKPERVSVIRGFEFYVIGETGPDDIGERPGHGNVFRFDGINHLLEGGFAVSGDQHQCHRKKRQPASHGKITKKPEQRRRLQNKNLLKQQRFLLGSFSPPF